MKIVFESEPAIMRLGLTAALLIRAAAYAEGDPPSAAVEKLQAEVKALAAEVVACRLELTSGKLLWLQQQMAAAVQEQQRLESILRLHAHELEVVEQELARDGLSADERAEFERVRAEVRRDRLDKTSAERDAAARLQAAYSARLRAEQQNLQTLWKRASALGLLPASNQ